MTIKLDWEVETERSAVMRGGEDPESKRRRRSAQMRFLLVTSLFILIGAGIVGAVMLRLREVDLAIERQLRSTVEAEVTALRLGDRNAFLDVQWQAEDNPSITASWLTAQNQSFDFYQTVKRTVDLNLTGQVLSATIDGQNGRVAVEEIVDGVPYARVWFYWRFEEGWLHVPTAHGFWGESQEIVQERFTINYRDVDVNVAEAIAAELPDWFDVGCAVVSCESLAHLTLEILPDEQIVTGWSSDIPNLLQIPSPYLNRARLDQPFDPSMRYAVAALWAERILQPLDMEFPSDAGFFKESLMGYLIGQFTQTDTGSYLINSLANAYGTDSLRQLASTLTDESGLNILTQITGDSLDSVRVDWRDFLTYRLRVEADAIRRRADSSFYALYDATDSAVLNAASARFTSGMARSGLQVISAVPERANNGTAHLRAIVSTGGGSPTEEILFRLVDGNWKRAS